MAKKSRPTTIAEEPEPSSPPEALSAGESAPPWRGSEIVNYTMSERATHGDFSVRNQDDALPNLHPHRHEYFQIHVRLPGAPTHSIGSVPRPVAPGTICFIPPYKLHFIPTVPDSEYYLINTTQSFMLPGLNIDPLDLEDVLSEQAPELAPCKYQDYLDFALDGEDLETIRGLCRSMLKENVERGPGSLVLCRAY